MHINDNQKNDPHNDIYSDLIFKNKIIILKKVRSIRQLKNTEKEWVRLCYKEAVLKGATYVKDIQCYIASKTKIWIERTGIEYLKKSEEEENKKWYINLAKDHFAYVGVHRRIIDELEQYKKELWSIMKDPDSTNMERIQVTRELHSLTKTHSLILRDLPFITNLSKYYNLDLINSNSRSQQICSQKTIEDERSEKEIIDQKVSERLRKMVDESALFSSDQKRKMSITGPADGDDKITDHIMEEMRAQLTDNNHIEKMLSSEEYYKSIKKLKEITED